MTLRCYLGGPISGCDDAACVSWRKRAARMLDVIGITAVDPLTRTGDWRGDEERFAHHIVEGDKREIEGCDLVLVNLEHLGAQIHGHGSAMEIIYAYEAFKPVVLVWPHDYACPVWDSYHALASGGGVYRSLDAALMMMPSIVKEEVDQG